ncbi:MAG: chromate reductase [Planctomycetota bacterium]|jgi:chromate reductase
MSHSINLLAFAGSTSRSSINKQLVSYAAGLLSDSVAEVVDLNDYELPLFSVDVELEIGSPKNAARFFEKIGAADALLISFAEHNGCYAAAFKNLFDWCSRINPKVYQGKPVVMLATSPGGRGGATVLEIATKSAPFFGADLRASLSIPSFGENFKDGKIVTPDIQRALSDVVNKLRDS